MQFMLKKILHKVYLLWIFLCLIHVKTSYAQLTVGGGLTATQLANIIAGPGITVSNATYNGAAVAVGSFNGTNSNIGLGSGVILTNGDISLAVGPNNLAGNGLGNGLPGSNELNGLAGTNTYDASTLEFDFIPQSNIASFKYIWASEEYPEFAPGSPWGAFNDVFAFYINGPGITGTQNIALVPGTTLPVAIANINGGYYNCPGNPTGCTNCSYYINNCSCTSPDCVEYDAFTTVLTASINVQACETYHLKLTIADAIDYVYDSAVFIEENSLVSSVVNVSATTVTADSTAYEGCTNGTINFTLSQTAQNDYTINYTLTGTATNGVDYNQLPTSVTIPAGQTTTSLLVEPINDGSIEGVESIIVSVQTSVCGFDTIYVFIDDNDPVSVDAFGDTSICGGQGGPVPIWAVGSGGSGVYLFSWDQGAGTQDTAIVNPATTTTYTITISDSTCSSSQDTAQVTVYAEPLPVANAGPDAPYCIGDPVTLTASGANSYEWYSLPGNTFIDSTASITVNPTGNMSYYVYAHNGGCYDYDTVAVTEYAPPVADAGPDTSMCGGENITLGASGGISYAWNPTTDLSDPNIANPTASPGVTTQYTVTVIDANGCMNSDVMTLTINPSPVANAGTDVSICLGDSVQLNGSGGASFAWSPATDLSDPNIPNPMCTSLSTITYTLTVTDANGCDSTDDVTVTITPLPTSDFILPASACVNSNVTVTYTGTSTPSATYNWNPGNAYIVSGTGQGPITMNWNTTGMDTVVLAVMENGCVAPPDTQVIDIQPDPISNAGMDIAFCSEETRSIGTAAVTGISYSWSPAIGLSSPSVANPNVTLFNTSDSTELHLYTVSATNGLGCNSKDSVLVTVYPIPVAEFEIPEPQCFDGHSFNFVASGVYGNGASFAWDFGTGAIPGTSNIPNPTGITYNAPTTSTVSVVATENGCVSDPYTASVIVHPMPIASLSALPLEGCDPLSVRFLDLSTANSAGLSYNWDMEATTSNQSTPAYTFTQAGMYDVYLSVTTVEGCEDDTLIPDMITVYPLPKAGFDGEPRTVSIFDPTVEFEDQSTGSDSCVYYWDGQEISSNCNFEYTFPDTGVYTITQVVHTIHGCVDTTELTIRVEPEFTLYIPSAFSPNSDSYNDIFYCYGIGIVDFEMNIFDRWGEQIYFSHQMDEGWDGLYKNKPAKNDVYIYRVVITTVIGDEYVYSGHVSLVR